MKKMFLALLGFMFILAIQEVQAKGVIIYGTGPKLEVTEKLSEEAIIGNTHVNLGVMYDQFSLFWLPVWNYSKAQYVYISDDETTYWDLDEEDIAFLSEEYKIELTEASPSLWNKIGLKPVIIFLVITLIWGAISSKKDEEEGTQEKPTDSTPE